MTLSSYCKYSNLFVWILIFILPLIVGYINNTSCDFREPELALNKNTVKVCSLDLANVKSLNIVCPRIIENESFELLPYPPNKHSYVPIYTGLPEEGPFVDLHLKEIKGIVGAHSSEIISFQQSELLDELLINYVEKGTIIRHNIDFLLFFCKNPNQVFSASLLKRVFSTRAVESRYKSNLHIETFEDENDHGIGMIIVHLIGLVKTPHGCSGKQTTMFENLQFYNESLGAYYCQVNVMQHPNMAFFCNGRVFPDNCFENLLMEHGEIISFKTNQVKVTRNEDAVIATYYPEYIKEEFNGLCLCYDSILNNEFITGIVLVSKLTHHKYNMAKLIPTIHPKTNERFYNYKMVLQPGDSLSIKFPMEDMPLPSDESDTFTTQFEIIPDITEDICIRRHIIDGEYVYVTDFYRDIFSCNAFEIDATGMNRGFVTFRYKKNLGFRHLERQEPIYYFIASKYGSNAPSKARVAILLVNEIDD
ncbi:hypothetical protein BdWA1_002694 [Babesia duncani]|uniref:6-Cys domain-containing protein n=1 Tax=Babesia duncani TaxID=323732 RepID=A0AAD9PJP1_9APIC|nr:hypothetical protein BdWA1_002694 [Babesia duncani]